MHQPVISIPLHYLRQVNALRFMPGDRIYAKRSCYRLTLPSNYRDKVRYYAGYQNDSNDDTGNGAKQMGIVIDVIP